MVKVIGVRFRTAGKVYYFDPGEFEVKRGEHVIVETARGIEYGTVVMPGTELPDEKITLPLKGVLRIATERDDEQALANKEKEREAFRICFEKIRKHELEMKLIDAEYTFDNNKVLFYFTADGRIDFRELVKDLAAVFRTRIELRQIGVRDETKILGGIGICGRPLCCHTHLSEFAPVSIKMAKEQNLSLNPTKISGVCGRLMCCLKNEEETYEELNRKLPGLGDFVTTDDDCKGEVHSVNVLRQTVKVLVENGDEKELKEYRVDQLTFTRKRHKNQKNDAHLADKEEQELAKLEKLDELEHIEKQKNERAERGGKQNHGERRERQERGGRAEKANRGGQNRGEQQERVEKQNRGEQQERVEKQNRGEQQERPNKEHGKQNGRSDRQGHGGHRNNHGHKPRRFDNQEGKPKSEDN